MVDSGTAITIGGYVVGFAITLAGLKYAVAAIKKELLIHSKQINALREAVNSLTDKWLQVEGSLRELDRRIGRIEAIEELRLPRAKEKV